MPAIYGHTYIVDRRKARLCLNHLKDCIILCSEQLTSLVRSEDENRIVNYSSPRRKNVRDGHMTLKTLPKRINLYNFEQYFNILD